MERRLVAVMMTAIAGVLALASIAALITIGRHLAANAEAPPDAPTGAVISDPPPGPSIAPRPHVAGNKIVDSAGREVRLLGANRSGGEFSCVQSKTIWDGPMDEASIEAIASWHINTVRVALNEDCWLGVPGLPASRSGAAYRQAVQVYLARLEAHGIIPMLELHWSSGQWTGRQSQCSSAAAVCQKPMPGAEHAPDFWSSVAGTFKNDQSVMFDLFNEPYPNSTGTMTSDQSWTCWRDGSAACPGLPYSVAGVQTLLDAVRRTGARNVVFASGNGYAGDLSRWLDFRPADPTGNIAAAWHSYDYSSCNRADCWEQQLVSVAAQVPVVATEIGETDCRTGYVTGLMDWLDSHAIGYLAWTWNVWDCSHGPALITDYRGTPTPYGVAVRDHLRSR
jgi:hypothetical protein